MKRLKEKVLEDNQLSTPSPTDRSTLSTPSSTPPISSSSGDPTPSTLSHTPRSNDTYVYGVGILAVFAIGACAFFAYNTFQPKKTPQWKKRSATKIYNKWLALTEKKHWRFYQDALKLGGMTEDIFFSSCWSKKILCLDNRHKIKRQHWASILAFCSKLSQQCTKDFTIMV